MQEILRTIIIGYLLFLVSNFDVLIFLLSYPIDASVGIQLHATKPKKCVKLSGMAYGYVAQRGIHRVVVEAPTLYGTITLNITPFTKMIGMRNILYGDQVMVYGKLRVVLGEVCLVPTRIICYNDEKKIKASLRKRLSLCMWLSIMLEVVYYVISLQI